MSERVLMKGNEALAEAAIRAGCRHFFGYPITPQTELAAYMSKVMPKIGGTYLQAESEIAAVNMVLGAASAGVRAMTSSSSPGISLKTEGISYMAGSDLPAVISTSSAAAPDSAESSPLSRITGRRQERPATAICIFLFSLPAPSRRWSTSSAELSTRLMSIVCPR